jgi:DNA-binding MarR family transcriptional regulator
MTKHYDVNSYTSGNSLGYLVKLAHILMLDRANEAFVGHDLSFMQWIVLVRLREGRELTASDLCRVLRHDTGALTRMLDQLEERGYLQRNRSREDRRVVHLQLTDDGLKKATELTPLIVDRLNDALADFSKAEFAELCRLLTKLIDKLDTDGSINGQA